MESLILSQVKLDFIINNVTLISRCCGKNWLFWFCERSACVSGKTKCTICVWTFSVYICSLLFYYVVFLGWPVTTLYPIFSFAYSIHIVCVSEEISFLSTYLFFIDHQMDFLSVEYSLCWHEYISLLFDYYYVLIIPEYNANLCHFLVHVLHNYDATNVVKKYPQCIAIGLYCWSAISLRL